MGEDTAYAFKILKRVAPRCGVKIKFERDYGYAGELQLSGGHRVPFLGRNLNINPSASLEIAKDKGYTNYFLRDKGFSVPEGKVFFSEELNKKIPPP